MDMNTKRLTYFDMAKGIGIILVVLGHIEYISEPLRAWISSFHMPLFFIVSGMLIHYKDETSKDLRKTLQKKWHSIIIPYFWFSLLYFLIDILNVILHKIDLHTFLTDQIHSISFYGISVLWFLPALFIAESGFLFFTKKLPRILSICAILFTALLSYFIQIGISRIYTAYETSLLITSLIDFVRVFLRGAIAMSFVCIAYYLFYLLKRNDGFSIKELLLGIVLFGLNIPLSQVNTCVDFHYIILKNVPLFYICALSGSAGLILLCKNIKNIRLLGYFGKNSLIIMSTHVNCYILYAAILIAWQIDTFVTRAKSYVFLFNIMLFTFLFEIVLIELINRFFPFILGKKRTKQAVCREKK
ncbi:MAG TPA: acyltransferase family protein [Lachnospiraceae bacterium]|nr:acyltransferase family protein [Lachnospiraceae bacterium]